jgi:hypothetical protein
MLNDPLVHDQAEAAAQRMMADRPESDGSAIRLAFRQTLGRAPSDTEMALAQEVLADDRTSPERAWANLYHMLFASLDFRYRD